MKTTVVFVSALGVAVLLSACNPTTQNTTTPNPNQVANTVAGTETCMTCHEEGTEINNKIQNARDSWAVSAHAKGQLAELVDTNGGASTVIGHELEGSNAFYANAGGCQICHTKEGFVKKATGKYGNSFYGEAKAISDDYIQNPSSLTCFTCHAPHTKKNFDLIIPASESFTMTSGATYNKPAGSVCISCHQSRTEAKGANQTLKDSLQSTSGLSSRLSSHYSVQGDMLYGKGAADYTGKNYSNGPHTSMSEANCVTCHMTYPKARFSGSAGLAGHSFKVTANVHGSEVGNTAGCVTCHDPKTTKAKKAGDSGAVAASGHLYKGRAYFEMDATDKHYDDMNKLLTAIVDPATGNGLLKTAYESLGATGSMKFDAQGIPTAFTALKEATASLDANPNHPKLRWAKAYYNYYFVKKDHSFGVHNNKYAKQILRDTVEDLADLTGTAVPVNLPARP